LLFAGLEEKLRKHWRKECGGRRDSRSQPCRDRVAVCQNLVILNGADSPSLVF
jgi:hypothetical protein